MDQSILQVREWQFRMYPVLRMDHEAAANCGNRRALSIQAVSNSDLSMHGCARYSNWLT